MKFSVEREIAGVQVRAGFFGNPVLQYRRQRYVDRIVDLEVGMVSEKAGLGEWRDAKRKVLAEVAIFVSRMG